MEGAAGADSREFRFGLTAGGGELRRFEERFARDDRQGVRCGGLKWLVRNQVSLRSLILVFCFASRFGERGLR